MAGHQHQARWRGIALACLVGLSIWLATNPPRASAHAIYVRSEPPSGGKLATPGQIVAYFSEDVDPGFSELQVLDATLRRVDRHDTRPVPNDRRALSVTVPQLPDGTYTVAWRTLSAVDGHNVKGAFPLVVGEGGVTTAAVVAEEPPNPLEVLLRALTFAGSVLLFGGFTFGAVILGLAGRARPADPARALVADAWDRRFRRLGLITVGVLILTGLAWVLLQVILGTGASLPDILGEPVARYLATRNGLLAAARLGILVALAACLWLAPRRLLVWLGLLLTAALILITSLTSHAAALNRGTELTTAMDWLHQAAAAMWLGGLAAMLLVLPDILRADALLRAQLLGWIVPRLSALALIGVGLLVVTGVFAALIQVGSLQALGTMYGSALVMKIGLLAGMLVLGAINNRVFTPWFASAARPNARVIGGAVLDFVRRFRMALAAELGLGIAVLIATGVLTAAEPARDAWARQPKPIDIHGNADDLAVRLAIEPGRVGENTYTVTLRDPTGAPPADVQRVQLRFSYVDQALGRGVRTADLAGPGAYQTTASDFSIAGRWQVDIAVRRVNREDAIAAFLLDVGASTNPLAGSAIRLPAFTAPYTPITLAALIASLAGLLWIWLSPGRASRRAAVAACAAVGLLSTGLLVHAADFSPDLLTLRNPLPVTPAGLERGQELYLAHGCVTCHGEEGRGDGPLSPGLRPPPADFRVHMAAGHTDGQIYDWLTNGFPGTAMRGYGSELTEEERWLLINYIRSFASS